jgi:hypothetical protein
LLEPRDALRLPTDGPAWWLMVLALSAVTAAVTMTSVQMGCALALVILTVGLYSADRTAGVIAVWTIWLLAPLLRRVFFLSDPIEDADPLALAPFVATGAVAAAEALRGSLSKRVRRMLAFVLAGYIIGMPVGFLQSPESAAFGFFAYLSGAACLVIGYREAQERRTLVLPAVLIVLVPVLALYAFRQYYLPLPEWDQVWFNTAEIGTTGSPDEGRVRVWGTLNSPGTFATVLAVATIVYLTVKRLTPFHIVGGLAVLGALALTYVRSAWIGVVAAAVAIAVVSRGAALSRLVVLGLLMVALAPVAFSGSAGAALTDRFNTLGALESDESAQTRSTTGFRLVPRALQQPLGVGVGQAGEASRLGGRGFRYTDNGYLSLLFQTGPVGFVLVMTALVMVLRSAWRNVRRFADATNVLVAGVLAYFLVTMIAGDQLYGVPGMMLWYVGGVAVARAEREVD